MYPTTLFEKKEAAINWFASAVASEDPATPNHERRLNLARQLLHGGGMIENFVTVDFKMQGFDDDTLIADVQNRLSGLATNLLALGLA